VLKGRLHAQFVCPADHFMKLTKSQQRHPLTHFLGHEPQVVDDVFGFALKALAQFGVLCGNAESAGTLVAFAQQSASQTHQCRCPEAKPFSSQQGADYYIAPRTNLPVHLHANAVAQFVHHQNLLGFGQP